MGGGGHLKDMSPPTPYVCLPHRQKLLICQVHFHTECAEQRRPICSCWHVQIIPVFSLCSDDVNHLNSPMWWCSCASLSVIPPAAICTPYSLQLEFTDCFFFPFFFTFLQDDYVRSWDENQGSNDSKFHTFYICSHRQWQSKTIFIEVAWPVQVWPR